MSQIYLPVGDSPSVATSYVTDVNSPAIPLANILGVVGGSSSANNVNGIRTDGGSGSDVLTIQLTNKIQGTATTTDGTTPVTFCIFPLGSTPGTYLFTVNIAVFDVTDSFGAVYTSFLGRTTNGSLAFAIGTDTFIEKEQNTLSGIIVSPGTTSNQFEIDVTGLAGKTINYLAIVTYIFVS